MRPAALSLLERRLRHANSEFEETSYVSTLDGDYYDWIDCIRTRRSFFDCGDLLSNETIDEFASNQSLFHISNDTSFYYTSTPRKPSQDEEELRELYRVVVPVMLTACILSLVFNLIIVYSVRWLRKSLSPTLYLSLSLAVADAYASLVLGVGLVVNSLLPTVYGVDLGPFNACYLLVLEAFRLGGIVVAVLHLLALAINHYVGILRPLHYASTVTRRTVMWAMAAMWILPVVVFLAYFSLVPNDGFRSFQCSSYDFLLRIPFRVTVSVLFFVPLILMSIMYVHMFIVVKRHQRGVLQLPSSRQLHKSVKAIITTLLILGTYVLGWMPAVLYFILTCLDCPVPFTEIHLWVRVPVGIITNSMIVIKSFVDPIIYVVRMPEIKGAMRSIFRTRCGFIVDETGDHPKSKSEMNRLTILGASRRTTVDMKSNSCNGGDVQMMA
ncbi:adrenocorticotropic hormone receptor-like [Stegodyphus dumicola]|uniref:adrenocorticotropic hormone receptor-like n=1 Tax=Stegodyphus dumicola TaxID=202533 RepID=UPI0015B124A3|nr:adrenocorticotropic hormone receptor-like [Stegodyphus dumicola]